MWNHEGYKDFKKWIKQQFGTVKDKVGRGSLISRFMFIGMGTPDSSMNV